MCSVPGYGGKDRSVGGNCVRQMSPVTDLPASLLVIHYAVMLEFVWQTNAWQIYRKAQTATIFICFFLCFAAVFTNFAENSF